MAIFILYYNQQNIMKSYFFHSTKFLSALEECDIEQIDLKPCDPESFIYDCMTVEEVERLLNESVEKLSTLLQVTPSLAKVLLHEMKWNTDEVVEKYRNNASNLLVSVRIKPPATTSTRSSAARTQLCPVCVTLLPVDKFHYLSCGHAFCCDCWTMHFETQIGQGISTQISCMEQMCNVRVPEDFVLNLLNRSSLREKYQRFAFADYVKSHPQLRFCPGRNCHMIVRSDEISPKKTNCKFCKTSFCFLCGMDYHAPTDCVIIKKWMTKCADDSETANYISAHTKDCPKCHICIEKNGGCNHMQVGHFMSLFKQYFRSLFFFL
jgi:ariadne-2